MAGAMVGEALLSASLEVLLDRIASREFISFFSKRKLDDGLIDKLKITLLALQALLDDAEDKQITNKRVKDWLDELQHVIYQADDLLDEIATEALRLKLEADQSSTTQVGFNQFFLPIKQYLLPINSSVSTSAYLSDNAMKSRMEGVISKLEGFVEQKGCLHLRENVGRKEWARLQTTSLVDEYEVYGRDNDKEKIINLLLLSGHAIENEILVIPIVGMGGVGKTTLAQLVYNDARVKQNFDIKVWVCVSDEFDVTMITKKILQVVSPLTNVKNELDQLQTINNDLDQLQTINKDLDQLQTKLKESLEGKKILIVLDDVWNDDYIAWDLLKKPFMAGAQESRIIITTRMDKVASIMSNVPSCHLKKLPSKDCWSLFAKHAFVNGDYMSHPTLEMIGRKIVKKCKGLPLAIKSLGGILRSKLEIDEWKYILNSELWDLKESNILPALRLSYYHLPSHLKRCFAYCSIFLKDYKFRKEKLVQLWIAENLVQRENKRSFEDVGNHYFQELLSRSFFHRLSGNNSNFVMHDLIHELAQHIVGEFCFMLGRDKAHNISKKVRHLSYVQGQFNQFEKFKVVNKVEYLRSFIGFPRGEYHSFLSNKVLNDMVPNLRCLRVLSLSRYQISELPQSIENLIHLRYLDLSHTKIKQLPESVTTLCNLQTLDLSYCKALIELPVNMGKLIKLRYLDIRETILTEMPMQMGRLKNLVHLTYFVVGKNDGSRIGGLKELSQLRGQLCILGLENLTGGSDASKANLKGKKYLEGLELKWGGDCNDSQKEKEVLDQLEPHAGVKNLSIINYGGTSFPNWLERIHSFRNMVSLKLIRCANCYFLPSIGQLPSLKHLRIEGMKEITEVCHEFYGDATSSSSSSLIKSFQSLETLRFDEMSEWKEWHALGAGEFSRLVKLSLVNCPKLIGELPNHLLCLRDLTISGCQQLLSNQVAALLLQGQSSLKKLEISGMPNLKELPPELCGLLNLKSLEIKECGFLESALEMGLPPMLKTLKIGGCEALKSVTITPPPPPPPPSSSKEGVNLNAMRTNHICLEDLHISDCSSLLQLSFPIGGLPPPTLKTLGIYNCRSLEFPLPSEEETEHDHTSIEVLEITRSCDLLKSLVLGFFPKLRSLIIEESINFEKFSSIPDGELQNLTKLIIFNCKNLKSLPQRMHSLLPSLKILHVKNCPEVESFLEGGLPSNLITLGISNCEKLMKGRMGWGLQQTLPSLRNFIVEGEYKEEELESFPEEWLLPTTLTILQIYDLPNLKSLNHKGLQHLTSLAVLRIVECPKLQSLPEEGLPNSLSYLYINDCPLLKPRCQRDKGEDWPNISRIRHIRINGEDIVDLE